MKKLITSLLTLTFLASCGKNETEYLYDKYDGQDFQAVLAAQQKECETKNKIFEKLDLMSDFSNLFKSNESVKIFKVSRSYKITQNGASAEAERNEVVYIAVKKNLSNEEQVDVSVAHSSENINNLEYTNLSFTYEQEDNKKLLATAIKGYCSEKYGGSVGSTIFQIVSDRENITSEDPEEFVKVKESFNFETERLAFLSRWNGSITKHSKDSLNDIKESWTVKGNIEEVKSASDCRNLELAACKVALDNVLPPCSLDINETHYTSKDPDQYLTKFQCN